MKSLVSVALIATFALSSTAFAGTEDADKKPAKDPNRLICKAEPELGSRLTSKKQCMTAQQWEEQRRLSRMEIDRSQASNYKNN